MKHDAVIAVRFLTSEEGGRNKPVDFGIYKCPMFVDGQENAFDCRVEIARCDIELGQWYCLPVRFLYLEAARGGVVVGRGIALWEGKLVAKGFVVEVAA